MNNNKRKGFASMTPERRKQVQSYGGKRAHELGTAHKFTSEEARKAGKISAAAKKAKKIERIIQYGSSK